MLSFVSDCADLNPHRHAADCPVSVMEKEEANAGMEYLTPTKSFSKNRVTAGAAIMGEVFGSPKVSLAWPKSRRAPDGGAQM